MGIEPTLEAWEAAVLPLNYTRSGVVPAAKAAAEAAIIARLFSFHYDSGTAFRWAMPTLDAAGLSLSFRWTYIKQQRGQGRDDADQPRDQECRLIPG
jgi:hypothetical protein